MKLLQLYYTSCKRGHASGSGFQVYSASEEFSSEEINELERLCMYIPPNHLPTQPTPEQISNDFPVAFSSFRLKSGRYGVCQSVYLGKDYSERYGNYFSHALVLEEGEWPFAPILLYGSSLFRKNLTLDELEIGTRPEPLPVINMPLPNGIINTENVKEFLEKEDRYSHLENMLGGIMDNGGETGSLVLAAKPEEIPFWMGAIQFSIPIEIAGSISFSTYVYDPDRAEYVVSATLDQGTRYTFQSQRRNTHPHVFNFISGIFSNIPNSYRYPEMVSNNRLNIDSFKNFYRGFTLEKFNQDFEQALDLYNFQGEIPQLLELSLLDGGIQFADKYASSMKKGELISKLSLEQLLFSCTAFSTAKIVSTFLIKTCNETHKKEHESKAVYFLLETVKDFVTDGEPLEEVQKYFNDQYELMQKNELIDSAFLQKEYISDLHLHLLEMNDETKEEFYLKLALQFITNNHIEWDRLSDEQQKFVLQFSSHLLNGAEMDYKDWILHARNPEFFGHFILRAQASVQQKQQFNKLLKVVLTEKENDIKWMRLCLSVMSESELVLDSVYLYYRNRLAISSEKTKELLKIIDETSHLSRFVDPLYIIYYDSLFSGQPKILDEAIEIMKHQKLKGILAEKKLLIPILEESQSHIEFTDSHVNNYHREYDAMFTEFEDGHILELALVTRKLKMKERGNHTLARKSIEYNIGKLNEKQIQSYLVWSLPELLLLSYTRNPDDKSLILGLVKNHPQYVLAALHQRKKDSKMQYSTELFVDILKTSYRKKFLHVFHDDIVEYLVANEEEGKKVNELLKGDIRLQKNWAVIYQDVQNQTGHSFIRSVKKLFGSKR